MLSKQDTLDAHRRHRREPTARAPPAAPGAPLSDTTNDPIIAERAPQPWRSWQRSEDYYSEGQLIWIDVDRIIREQSGGKRSIDDFAKAFFGVNDRDYGELTYTFDDIVSDAQPGQPYDWRGYLQRRVYDSLPTCAARGHQQGRLPLDLHRQPTDWIKRWRRSASSPTCLFGRLQRLDRDGKVNSVIWGTARHSMPA